MTKCHVSVIERVAFYGRPTVPHIPLLLLDHALSFAQALFETMSINIKDTVFVSTLNLFSLNTV